MSLWLKLQDFKEAFKFYSVLTIVGHCTMLSLLLKQTLTPGMQNINAKRE